MFVLALAACGVSQPPPQTPSGDETADPSLPGDPAPRKSLSADACAAQGGAVVGDIGDGATHRPNYVCASGKPPLGNIVTAEGEPIGIEGAVCCPQ